MFTFIYGSSILSPEQKEAITTNLEKSLQSWDKYEAAVEAQRHNSPWVQSTELSDRIAKTSRERIAILHYIETTISKFTDFPVDDFLNEIKNVMNSV